MTHFDDDDEWLTDEEANAADAAADAELRIAYALIIPAGIVLVASLALSVVMVVAAVEAVLTVLCGWLLIASAVYLLGIVLVAGAIMAIPEWKRWWLAAKHQAPPSGSLGPEPHPNELLDRDMWIMRAVLAPTAALACTYAIHIGLPTAVAVVLAALAWLSFDLATLITVRTRRQLHRLSTFKNGQETTLPEA